MKCKSNSLPSTVIPISPLYLLLCERCDVCNHPSFVYFYMCLYIVLSYANTCFYRSYIEREQCRSCNIYKSKRSHPSIHPSIQHPHTNDVFLFCRCFVLLNIVYTDISMHFTFKFE